MKTAFIALVSSAVVASGCGQNETSHPSGSAPPHSPTASTNPGPAEAAAPPLDWKTLEAPLLTEHVQLTSRDVFVRAGEAYFDHQSPPRWVIFQAVAVPEAGKEAEPFYSMYVAKLRYEGEKITGIERAIRISPDSSANTCGWFDPKRPWHVIFGSTLTTPSNTQKAGFRVGDRKYVWMFPQEMEVVSRSVFDIAHDYSGAMNRPPKGLADWDQAQVIISRPNYDAECSYSKDGRFILYAHVRDEETRGRADADIWVFDTKTGKQHEIVHADGYDGGPFFSPDGKRICYRSDRKGDDLLQLFVADLKFDADGVPIGIVREHQVTANEHVNWAPYWHPSGKFLVYGTSEMGHQNYEVFAVEVPEASDQGKPAAQLRKRRVTFADGADILPVFSDEAKYMMWTAQRGPMVEGESKPSSQVWVAAFSRTGIDFAGSPTGALTHDEALVRMTTLLKAREAETKAKVKAAGGACADFDLTGLKIVRIRQGWRGIVNVWNVPDGDHYIFALEDGRVFEVSAYAPLADNEVESLVFEPALPDESHGK